MNTQNKAVSVSRSAHRITTLSILGLALLVMLSGCGFFTSLFGGEDPGGGGTPIDNVRELDPSIWSRKTIAYSGYRTDQSPGDEVYPSEAEILQDLNLLVDEGFGLIRLYDSGTHAERTLNVIDANNLDLKVMLGIYFNGGDDLYSTANYAEMDRGIAFANEYPDTIVAVSIGNEVLVDWSFVAVEPADMVTYIQYVRSQITQPVTVNDNWEPWAEDSGDGTNYDTLQVWQQVDFAAIHTYAYWDAGYNLWDWRQETVAEAERAEAMMDAALAYAQENYDAVRSFLDANGVDIPIVIGESGWQSSPSATVGSASSTGHPVNQAMYYDRMYDWVYGTTRDDPGDGFARPAGLFYFAAFDEPWKQADDNWGLWDVDRTAKYVLTRTGYSLADAVHYVPPVDGAIITENTFVVDRDAELADTGEAGGTYNWNSWENGSTADISTGTDTPPEGTTYAIVTPTTQQTWGWGMTLTSTDPVDLSQFQSSGNLVFELQTTYDGSLEIGFFTGSTTEDTGVDAYLTVDPASNTYGYSNDGSWHTVTIPISAIAAQAAPAFGQPDTATLDMTQVFTPFVIADRYDTTGNSTASIQPINLDNIRWEK